MARHDDKEPEDLRFGNRVVPFEGAFSVSIETGEVLVDKWGVRRVPEERPNCRADVGGDFVVRVEVRRARP